jgi:type I restriction enzyme R subunit
VEFLERVFGLIDRFKTRDEKLEDECENFITIYKPESKYIPYIKNFIVAYITSEYFRNEINYKRFPRDFGGFTMAEYKKLNGWGKIIPEYIKNYIPINQYMI